MQHRNSQTDSMDAMTSVNNQKGNQMTTKPDLHDLPCLKRGKGMGEDEICIMQTITLVTQEWYESDHRDGYPLIDSPACVHPRIIHLAARINDCIDDEDKRQKLYDLIPLMLDTSCYGDLTPLLAHATTAIEFILDIDQRDGQGKQDDAYLKVLTDYLEEFATMTEHKPVPLTLQQWQDIMERPDLTSYDK